MRHHLAMATAYETCNGREAQYTNYTEEFKGTLDYIWFSPEVLAVLAISQVDDESQLMQETALPSSTRPSDHVSLVATFMFHDAPVETAEAQQGAQHSSRARGHSAASSRTAGLPGSLGAGGPNPYHMGSANPLVSGSALTNPGADGLYMAGAIYAAQYL